MCEILPIIYCNGIDLEGDERVRRKPNGSHLAAGAERGEAFASVRVLEQKSEKRVHILFLHRDFLHSRDQCCGCELTQSFGHEGRDVEVQSPRLEKISKTTSGGKDANVEVSNAMSFIGLLGSVGPWV